MDEWTRDEIRRIGYLVVDLIAEHLSALPDRPCSVRCRAELARTVPLHARPG